MPPGSYSDITPTDSNVQSFGAIQGPGVNRLPDIQEDRDAIQPLPRPVQARHYTTLQDHADDVQSTRPTEDGNGLVSGHSGRREGFV
jgi:hypothetical protein